MESTYARAPFECICGFTAGTSFAWEKHLALRNTPYSTSKHSRIIRGSDLLERKSEELRISDRRSLDGYFDRSSELSQRLSPTKVADAARADNDSWPTPKALFHDITNESKTSPQARTQHLSVLGGPSLEEAAKSGDMDRVARLAVELLKVARQGDSESVLEIIGSKALKPRQSEVKFSAHISVVHEGHHGLTVDQVPTGLKESAPDSAGRKDALRLLGIVEPILDAAKPEHTGPVFLGVDIHALKRSIISVAQHAARITSKESRYLELKSPIYVLGDIHGNLVDLQFFRKTLWPAGPELSAGDFLFLGDFVDRGSNSIPVVAYVMAWKVLAPGKWWAIRGNHETREVNGNMDHYKEGSFLNQCLRVFGESDGYAVWEAVNAFFDTLPLAASIDGSIFCVHGGIPRELCQSGSSLDLIRRVECPLRTVNKSEMVYDMLWSDPASPEQEYGSLDTSGFGLSARGCTCFGERSIETFLRLHRFQHVFRGHEAQKSGVGVSKSARLTTIFSTSRDHFTSDISATCGCVLVDGGVIHPVVRAISDSYLGLKPTYAVQSVEASDLPLAHAPHSTITASSSSVATSRVGHSDGLSQARRAAAAVVSLAPAGSLPSGGYASRQAEARAWSRLRLEDPAALGLGRLHAWEEASKLSPGSGVRTSQWLSQSLL